ncbi:MAG: PAS domain S-box protein [Candidatus Marinarcus sp.]|uniref:PAS domain S-box protein n=1 Tax=Candidatus Marinarcus sp. TaxID=3100987 RepID=UPI003B009A9F
MKLSFFIKLFIAFLLFSFILFGLFSLFSKKFYEIDRKNKEYQEVQKALEYKEQLLLDYLNRINSEITAVNNSHTLQEYVKNTSKTKDIIDLFKVLLSSNENILQMKFLNLRGKELLRVDAYGKSIKVVPKEKLENKIIQDDYKNIQILKKDEIWNSTFNIYKEEGEIVLPVKYILRFIIKNEQGFISFVIDVNSLLQKVQKSYNDNTYIFDKEGNFLIHKNSKYSWSKYFFPNKNIYKEYAQDSTNILEFDNYVGDDFISKRVYLNSGNYIILLTKVKQFSFYNFFENFENYFFMMLFFGFIISVILAFLFSNPIANLFKKTEETNRTLDISMKKSSEELNVSLNIIDKHVMSIKLDKEVNIVDVSTAFCDVSGFSKQELIGRSHKVLMHPDMSDEQYDEMWNLVKQGSSKIVELKGIKKDGGYYWVESYIDPIFNDDAEIIGFTAIRNNITDKKIIENLYSDINYQVQEYNAIFENAHSGIGLTDLMGNFRKVNFMFSELLGYTSDELLKMSCFDIILKNSSNLLQKIFVEAQETGFISNIEKIFIHKDGTEIHLEISLNLLPGKKYFVLVVNSLQDKRKLQELNQNLELKIKKEVEKSRQKDKLHQEEQLRNIKLTSIGSLAAGITHEINTPLTYVKGNFEMMGYDIDDLPESEIKTRMKEDTVRIKEGINRIANIVESMREISQSSNEIKENVNIYSTIITALTMTYNRSKQISEIYINDKLFTIDDINKNEYEFICKVQKQRVEQVWIVIVNNALDELSNVVQYEKRVLKIYLTEDETDVIVSFEDNAGGIKEEMMNQIFDAFVSSKEHSGMGVGLNISKKIIEQQNGTITAFNKNGGAVFEVRLKK